MSPLKDLDQVLAAAVRQGPFKVAVAAGHDEAALQALARAEDEGLATAVLVGEEKAIRDVLATMPKPLARAEVVAAAGEEAAAKKAVELVKTGAAHMVLKGKLPTKVLMKAVLDKETGLRTGRLLSDAFLCEFPSDLGVRLLCITDGGINVAPDLEQKAQLIVNAVKVYHALGVEKPRVAVLNAVETPIPDHKPSEDAVALQKMWEEGKLPGCYVEGPLSIDLAISMASVKKKGHPGEVAGQADILLCPEIVCANVLAKATTYFCGWRLAHVTMGATAPVLIPSRADTPEAKFYSIALSALCVGKTA
jgi:phosphate butyryltransferase